MAVVYNDKVCVPANELIILDTRRKVGSQGGFISEGTYASMVRRGQLRVVRRSTPGSSALIEFDTMRPDIKRQYTAANGDPYADLAARSQKGILEEEMRYNNRAYNFFSAYRYGADRCLPPEKIDEYTLAVNVMEALLRLRDGQKRSAIGGRTRINVWERLGEQCQAILEVRDSRGKQMFPHNLPKSWKALKRKCETYEAARAESEEEGFRSVIHKNYGNAAALRMKEKQGRGHSGLAESLIRKFLGLHMNWNNVQIMEEYNKAAAVFGLEEIRSPQTVGAYREKFNVLTKTLRKGKGAWHTEIKKQIHREPPKTAFTFLVFDGWTVELVYQRERIKKIRENGVIKELHTTTYHERKSIVIVLDACCDYPVGYAIGDKECPDLIKEALKDAVKHAQQLFGARYMPVQMQSDHYAESVLFPYYQRMCKYFTPAEVGNPQAKIIEGYFKRLILKEIQRFTNFSGFGITSNKKIQPNTDYLEKHKKDLPTEEEVVKQIKEAMEKERLRKIDAYMKAWENTPDDRKILFPDELYLSLMGETSGRTNKLEARGIILERNGMRYYYDSLDRSLLDHLGVDWIVRYDPDDMSRILISNAGKKGTKDEGKEIGTLRYLLDENEAVPMALVDQKPEHFEHRKKIREFNDNLKKEIIATAEEDAENIRSSVYNFGIKADNILERLLITDSRGQHKDNRNALRLEAEDIEPEEDPETKVRCPEDDDDYDFDPTTAGFSR